jgi:hypothetical protein
MNRLFKNIASISLLALIIAMAGCSSDDPAGPAEDKTPPGLSSVAATGPAQVTVVFNEEVDPVTSVETANYAISETATPANTVAVLGAALDTDGRTVILTTAALSLGMDYSIDITGVADVSGNMANITAKPIDDKIDSTPPIITEATITGETTVVVVFNEDLDEATAVAPANYGVASGTDTPNVISCDLASDKRTVTMTTALMANLDLFAPYSVSVDGVKDPAGNTVQTTSPLGDQTAIITTVCGTGIPALGGDNMDPTQSDLYLPQDITVGPDGKLYVVDWNNHRVRVIDNGLIRTIIGTGLLGDAPEGNALEVSLNHPTNVSFGPDGNLYMAAWHNSKIMKYDMLTGYMSVYCAWAGARGWFGDGGPAVDAIINLPSSTGWGPNGNLYISDQANFCVRMIDAQSEIITTVVAQAHTPGFGGDGGLAIDAQLRAPAGQSAAPSSRLVFDAAGNLYLADTTNQRVRMVDTGGIIQTIAGNGVANFAGDFGEATSASLHTPTDVAINPLDGSVFIADKSNHRIRRVDKVTGVISTVAGIGPPGYSGDGGPATEAKLYEPFGIDFDSAGNLYIADTRNHRIRKVAHQ